MSGKLSYYEITRGKRYPLQLKASKVCDIDPECCLQSPDIVVKTLGRLDWKNKPEEWFWAIALNARLCPIAVFTVAHGGLSECMVDPRAVFSRLLLCGANGFLVVHNHPSGDTSPSKEDLEITHRLEDAGKLLRIPLLDHVILGKNAGWCIQSARQFNYENEE